MAAWLVKTIYRRSAIDRCYCSEAKTDLRSGIEDKKGIQYFVIPQQGINIAQLWDS